MKQQPIAPWWMEPGAQQCSVCGGEWHEETLIFCGACDQPICAVCIEELSDGSEIICVSCQAIPAGDEP